MSRFVSVTLALILILVLSSFSFSFSSSVEPWKRIGSNRLLNSFIGDDGRVYSCSGKHFFSFKRDGAIAWTLHLNYTCNSHIPPVHGGSSAIYVVAEKRVLKIFPQRVGTSIDPVQEFFGPARGKEGLDEITGLAASISSSVVLINVKKRGLFAFRLHGQLIWSAGPVLYQHGYRQGCKKNITHCYFTSKPVIDHCEATIFILNNFGELYSMSVHRPYFKWIRDLSSYGKRFTVTTGNNGRLYVTVPGTDVVTLSLDVFTGSVVWQANIGPLSSEDYEPVVDANGWISYGSLDGFLYSFSPSGVLKKLPKTGGFSNSVIQIRPLLDCSGYGVYVSRTKMEEKTTDHLYYVSALKPKNAEFSLLHPASGSIYLSESDPAKLLFNLSLSDLRQFTVDEGTLLAFFAASRIGNPLPCRSMRVKLASSCSQAKPNNNSSVIYTGDHRSIVLFLIMETVVLIILAALVSFCCVFWKKKKLIQGLDLGKFLEKRRSLQFEKKRLEKMIKEVEQKDKRAVQKLGKVRRKLWSRYSLGRDKERSGSDSTSRDKERVTTSYEDSQSSDGDML